MSRNIVIFIFLCIINDLKNIILESSTNSSDLECEIWKNQHIVLAVDVHYYNITLPYIKIDSFDDLNITTSCSPNQYDSDVIQYLSIVAKKNILFENDFNLMGVKNFFNLSHISTTFVFSNIKGFNEKRQLEKSSEQGFKLLNSIQVSNVIFDFYRRGMLLLAQACSQENFDSKTNFFNSIDLLQLNENSFYNNKICPYVFMNTKLLQMFFGGISNSLIFRNRVEFLNINKTKDFDLNIKDFRSLIISMYSDIITLNNLNPFVFKSLKILSIKGNLEFIEENLFENFNQIKYIVIKSDSLMNFFHRGTKWINSVNKNVNLSIANQTNFQHITYSYTSRLVYIEFDVQSVLLFNKYYKFPNEDICLFKDFPHSQLVLPLLVLNPGEFTADEECSCTIVWLIQKHIYFREVHVMPEYAEYFEKITINNCVRNDEYFNARFRSCNFSGRFENCAFTTFNTVSFVGIQSFTLLLKWFKYVIEVYIRTILCLIGLITNLFTLKIIRAKNSNKNSSKNHSKNFKNSMYKHICINSLFNILFCLNYLFSLMNICIFPKNSFCSSIWRTEFSQYFRIYVVLFLGNSLRLCCNISYIFFSVSRFALSGTSNKNKLRTFIEKQKIKRFYIILFVLSLVFSVFLIFENYVNKNFEEMSDLFVNNAYDIRYCQNSKSVVAIKGITFHPSFYFKCHLFKWLNIINNILNNIVFLFVSILIDILMIRYSNKVIREKKALNCPHLADAIQYKTKLNKMILTNGTLYFFSHIPEFIITLIVSFQNSNFFIRFCTTTFDCNDLIDMAQTFHFVSIGFQFFIFVKFDRNFQKSLGDLRKGWFANKQPAQNQTS